MKSLSLLSAVLFLILSCQDKDMNSNEKDMLNPVKESTIIDQSISGIKLGSGESTNSILPQTNNVQGEVPNPLILTNEKETAILELHHHPGDQKFSVSEFVLKPRENNENYHIKASQIKEFVSSRGIRIGMALEDVKKIFGKGVKVEKEGDHEIIKGKVEGLESSRFLRELNMPLYYATYTFKEGKLILAKWGLEYP